MPATRPPFAVGYKNSNHRDHGPTLSRSTSSASLPPNEMTVTCRDPAAAHLRSRCGLGKGSTTSGDEISTSSGAIRLARFLGSLPPKIRAPRFFQAPPRGECYFTLAFRNDFTPIRLSKGLSPSSCRTYSAHTEKARRIAALFFHVTDPHDGES